jgi:hypothetical protein
MYKGYLFGLVLLLLCLFVNPVVKAVSVSVRRVSVDQKQNPSKLQYIPGDFNSIELHAGDY